MQKNLENVRKIYCKKLQEMHENVRKVYENLRKIVENAENFRKYQKNLFIKIYCTKIVGNARKCQKSL